MKLYGWASYQLREARSAGFYRRANDDRNTIQIYPDGFLPIIAPDVDDYSAAGGATWNWGEWEMDSSLVYGKNKMAFTIENTLNRSLGTASKTEFDAGGFDYDQLVLNFSGVRQLEVGAFSSPLNVAIGLEARRESYSIFAGEPDSYRNGGVLLANGTPTQSGSQVFPGFRPSNVVDEDRTAVGAYLDLEANLTEKLLGSVAVRAEDYSDFGSNVTGKLALRYDFTEAFALRAAAQTGFRAPSPQQQFFTATSTNFIGGVPFDITTFPVSDPVAQALGAKPLDAEESENFSLGAVLQIGSREPDDRRLPDQHRQPHRAVGEPDAGERACLPDQPRLHRHRRRPLLHQRRRHRDPGRRHRRQRPVRDRRRGPLRRHARRELQQHRRDPRADHRAARGAEPGAGAVRPAERQGRSRRASRRTSSAPA